MGKDKEQKSEAPGNAFSRMNYLYQAAYLMTENNIPSSVSRYYIKVMKEISKKVVEKLHPDLKRTLCSACNYPLSGKSEHANVKIKHAPKKKRKKKKSALTADTESPKIKTETTDCSNKYTKSRVEVRNLKPNKISRSCCKCGFTKSMLQRPSYKIWIHEIEENHPQV